MVAQKDDFCISKIFHVFKRNAIVVKGSEIIHVFILDVLTKEVLFQLVKRTKWLTRVFTK